MKIIKVTKTNSRLLIFIEGHKELFTDFDFEEPQLEWGADCLHIARVNQLKTTSQGILDWCLGGFVDDCSERIRTFFCEDYEIDFDTILQTYMKRYMIGKCENDIIESLHNIIFALNGATSKQLANIGDWSADTVE